MVSVIVSSKRGDRGTIKDADGNYVIDCVSANLKTGRCIVLIDRDGQKIRAIAQRKPPLTFEPLVD